MILNVEHDPMGTAILDYVEHRRVKKLKVFSSMFDEDVMPVDHLFRTPMDMNALERMALSMCKGRILDVGAGAGCHALALQNQGQSVTAIDISPLSVDAMRQRGVLDVQMADFFTSSFACQYDTILMLMNGIGIVGKVSHLPEFFRRLDELLAPGGYVLTDSSDLRYIFEDEDGFFDTSDFEGYYGEVDYRMQYGKVKGESFDWLYIDANTLSEAAATAGYRVEIVREGEHYDYLAKITRVSDVKLNQ